MKTIYSIWAIYASEVGQPLFDEVSAIYPEGQKNPRIFEADLPQEDPRLQLLMKTLERSGYRPKNLYETSDRNRKYYHLQISREYNKQDLVQMAYLAPTPKTRVGCWGREDGKLVLFHEYESKIHKERMTHVEDSIIIVTNSLRKRLEATDLLNLVFIEAVLDKPAKSEEPLWEMTTDLKMPPLSDKNVLIDNNIQPYTAKPGQVCLVREGLTVPEALYFPAELHYSAKALVPIEPFDLARTYEPMGQGRTHYLVASQRFHQFCVANKLKVNWQPVQVDQD